MELRKFQLCLGSARLIAQVQDLPTELMHTSMYWEEGVVGRVVGVAGSTRTVIPSAEPALVFIQSSGAALCRGPVSDGWLTAPVQPKNLSC